MTKHPQNISYIWNIWPNLKKHNLDFPEIFRDFPSSPLPFWGPSQTHVNSVAMSFDQEWIPCVASTRLGDGHIDEGHIDFDSFVFGLGGEGFKRPPVSCHMFFFEVVVQVKNVGNRNASIQKTNFLLGD